MLCWVFVAASRLSLLATSGGYSLVAVNGLLIVVASPVVEHGLRASRLQSFWGAVSVAPWPVRFCWIRD